MMREFQPTDWCALCGIELYAGSYCYRVEGRRICPACLAAYARVLLREAWEVVP